MLAALSVKEPMVETAEAEFPGLFRHKNRADWGVGVLSGERDGKRTYLFEGGEERVMGQGAFDMMSKLTSLDAEQRSTSEHRRAVIGRRRYDDRRRHDHGIRCSDRTGNGSRNDRTGYGSGNDRIRRRHGIGRRSRCGFVAALDHDFLLRPE